MEIHFAVMYPMLVNFLGFYGACAELGIDTNLVGKFLQGEDTKIMELDRELYGLATKARRAGLSEVFAEQRARSAARRACRAHGGSASQWLTDFDDFLASTGTARTPPATSGCRAGSRTTPTRWAWSRPSAQGDDHDFEAAARNALAEAGRGDRRRAFRLTREEQAVFDGGLAANQAANFPWWQDDHNFYIDLKVMLPLRQPARSWPPGRRRPPRRHALPVLAGAARGGRGTPLLGRAEGSVEARRQYFDHWHVRRSDMPKVLGTVPETVEDPVLIEIFGINPNYLRAAQNRTRPSRPRSPGVPRRAARPPGVAGCCRAPTSCTGWPRARSWSASRPRRTGPGLRQDRRRGCDGGRACSATRRSSAGSTACRRSPRSGWPRWPSATGTRSRSDGTNGRVTILKRAAELVA
jgi:pyruvate,water dikinase